MPANNPLDNARQQREWYYRNRIAKINRKNHRIDSIILWLYKYKQRCGCKICGENDPIVLDFHHRDRSEKEYNISSMVRRGMSRAKIYNEMIKCDILCANCHRRVDCAPVSAWPPEPNNRNG